MPGAEARVPTAGADRHLLQLCRHFGRALPTRLEAARGRIAFQGGRCSLEAAGETLVLRIAAEDPAALVRLKTVLAEHLQRFAPREPLAIDWRPLG
ncbi:DUF2218 domain-containing protein [Roseicella frigidaeris]|uniref:DUF2218 domain-containing protein n=1 Tax=Roseicella frigidaeris TaxID=2230885 RepID=A0A327M662_9PROT|nr:DUF2218 domain-containing protein [Roseicella frigidaeris]RAI57794.1 DUF2218 domain-containing protein [Roseicella frigidaeris]